METENDLNSVFVKVLDENNAQDVFNRLQDLDSRRLVLASRWVWELIQNARGTVESQGQLKIEVALEGDRLAFRHNGPPFKDHEIAHLILHGSTKHDPKDIGKFGTGFITTHLISRRVRVRGRLINGQAFDFVLDREGASASELRDAMRSSWDQFQESLPTTSSEVAEPYTTEFAYPLNESVRDVVIQGLQDLKLSAAFIFAFNPTLYQLTVVTADGAMAMSRETLSPLEAGSSLMGLMINGQAANQWIVTSNAEDVIAAMSVNVSGDSRAVELPLGIPRLFVAFPLNGTESLPIPLVLNSELFVPLEGRDGVYLGAGQNDANKKNMELFVAGCHRIVELISLAANQHWLNAAKLTCLQPMKCPTWANEKWLRTQIRSVLIQGFRSAPILQTISGELINPTSAWVPVEDGAASSLDLWSASEPLTAAADRLPRRGDQGAWACSVQSWTTFSQPEEGTISEIWTVGRLADHLASLCNMAGIADALGYPMFSIEGISDLVKCVIRLTQKSDPISEFLWNRLLHPEQSLLTNYQPSDPSSHRVRDAVVQVLNRTIGELCIYEPERFRGVSMRSETISLVEQKPAGTMLKCLNRQLLEDAYPEELSRKHDCAIQWVNRVHQVVCKAGRFDSFSAKPMVPNQQGDLRILTKLYKDGGIDSCLKDIGDLLGVHVRAELIDPGIETPKILDALNVRSEDQVIQELLDVIRQRAQQKSFDDATWKANVSMFSWLLKRGKTGKLEGFPVLQELDQGKKQDALVLQANKSPSELPLAPCAIWPGPARAYADLLPEKVIMDQRYALACDDVACWQTLANAGFLLTDLHYEAKSVVDEFLPDEPLNDDEQKSKPRSETPSQRTEIAWLSALIDRARGSKTRAVKLVRLLIDYILPDDPDAFKVETVHCDNGVDHRYYRANWLGLLRSRRWVPLDNDRHDRPSAEGLASLLAGDQDLLKRLGEERVSKLLEILGVSPSALMLQSVGSNDQERMSLIQSLATITQATGNDAAKVQALAGAIQKDPEEVIKIVVARQARAERVQRNQELGKLVEQLFVEVFKGSDLAVYRDAKGQDFRIEAPPGEDDDAGQVKVSSASDSILFEVKATTGGSVRMSVLQVENAIINRHRYFLCVVGTVGQALDAEAFKAQVRFVVNIGERVEHLWSEYCSMKNALGGFQKSDQGLTVEVTGQDVWFRVDEDVWKSGMDFASVLCLVKARLLPP